MERKVFVIGDVHGDVWGLKQRLEAAKVPHNSLIVVLGELCVNYWLDSRDSDRKKFLSQLPYVFLALHGNHEARPWEVEGYKLELVKYDDNQAYAYTQAKYPNIHLLIDGHAIIKGKKILILGGAYSVDKDYRLAFGQKWWASEQMEESLRNHFLESTKGSHYELVLSHTCPYMARPLDKGLSFVDQSKVDSTMEVFLERIRQQITYDLWAVGHWHLDEVRRDEAGVIHFVYQVPIEV